MAGTPNPNLGTLNRVRGSLVFANNAALNVVASMLGKAGISARPTSEAGLYLATMTGAVTSPEPFQIYDIEVAIVKTTPLATAMKNQIETLVNVGDGTYIPDATNLPNWQFANIMLRGAGDMNTSGTDPIYLVRMMGTYQVNSAIYNL